MASGSGSTPGIPKLQKPLQESGIFVKLSSLHKQKGVLQGTMFPYIRSCLRACERISYFRGKHQNTFLNVDLANVLMPEKSLSLSSSLQMTFTEVKCKMPMMHVAITRRGVWGASPPRRWYNTISAPST